MFQKSIDISYINAITKNADCFISRSENYLKYTPKLHTEQITLSSDMIFSDDKLFGMQKKQEKNLVVISLANIFESNTDAYKEKFISEIVELIQYILKFGFKVHLIPFTNEIDMELNETIAKRINDPNLKNMAFEENPYKTFSEVSRASVCIGMRFHTIVMALSCCIPCLSISYSDKNKDVMHRFGLDEYTFRFGISNFEYFNREIMINSSELINGFKDILFKYDEIRQTIYDKSQTMRKLSEINREQIKLLFE